MSQALSLRNPACRTLSLSLLFASLAFVSLRADPLDHWHLRNPLLQAEAFADVSYGGGLFVAVGDGGTIQTSADGAHWTQRHSEPDLGTLAGSAYGPGRFVAVSNNGRVLTSLDGITWITLPSSFGTYLHAVAYGNGKFVAVGARDFYPYAGFSLTSSNGLDWSAGSASLGSLSDVAFGNGTFVAVGTSGGSWFSTNGVDWISRPTGTGYYLNGVGHGNGGFVAVSASGQILTTSNGLPWIVRTNFPTTLSQVAYGGGRFVAVSLFGQPLVVSSNAVDWVQVQHPFSGSLLGVASDNNIFVAVGDAGAVLTAAEPLQAQSWTNRSTLTSSTLTDVTFGDGLFVAVGGSGALLTSDNGSSWISRVSGSSNDLAAAASGGGQYVVVGPGEILRSSDGAQWTRTFADPNTYFHAVAYGSGTFIAVGTDYSSDPQAGFFDTPIYRSPDGNVWTKQAPGVRLQLGTVATGNGIFVILSSASEPGSALVSSNGIDWICHRLPASLQPYALNFVNGEFIVPGYSGFVAVSPDGAHWLQRPAEAILGVVAHGGGQYVSVSPGYLATSFGGRDWITRTLPDVQTSLSYVNDVAYGAGTFVAVGASGVILQSDSLFATAPLPPVVVEPPRSATVQVGESIDFSVGATGSIAFNYQWRKNGVPIPGATNNIFFLAAAQPADAGVYSVAVSNAAGGVISQNALLHVVQLDPLSFWTTRNFGFTDPNSGVQSLRAVAYGNGQFVTMGDANLLLTSSNGVAWTRRLLPTAFSGNDLEFGNGTFVAMESSGPGVGGVCTKAMSSPDGITWSNATAGAFPFPVPLFLCTARGVGFGAGRFIAVGDETIHVSTNGNNWVVAVSGIELGLQAVTYGNGVFVAVGYDPVFSYNVILSSPDGFAWTYEDFDQSQGGGLRGITFGNGRFVVTGLFGQVLSSVDGINWENHSLPQGLYPQFGPVAYGGGWFVAADADNTYGRIWVSMDGAGWFNRPLSVENPAFGGVIRDITFGENSFVAVGDGGLIIQSDPLVSLPPAIVRQPRNKTVHYFYSATLSVAVSGSSPLTYEWFKDGKFLCVVAGPSLEIPNASLSDAGTYQVIVHNPYGSATSSVAVVTVEPDAPILSMRFDTQARLTMLLQSGAIYRIECVDRVSDFPGTWRPLDYIFPATSTFTWTDPESEFFPQRFYRVVKWDGP